MRSSATPPVGLLVWAIAFLIYATAGGVALSQALSAFMAPAPRLEPRWPDEHTDSRSVLVGITVLDAYCDGQCEDSFNVLCTTTSDRVATDWLLVTGAAFGRVYHELGCEPRAE